MTSGGHCFGVPFPLNSKKKKKIKYCMIIRLAPLRGRLWEELDEVVVRCPDTPLLFGGDFNVTLVADDRPDGTGGRDQGSEEF